MLFSFNINIKLLDSFQSDFLLLHQDAHWVAHELVCDLYTSVCISMEKMIASQKFCDGNIQEQCMTYYMITNLALHMQDNIPSTLLVGEWLRQ